jgi:hypothetical protein
MELAAGFRGNLASLLLNITTDARVGITAGDVAALNAGAATPAVLWWVANGFSGPVQVSDLIAAGDLS